MRKLKYPVLTIVSIPVFAFALFAMGCGSSGSPDRTMAPQNVKQDGIQGPIDPQNLRECTAEEFSKLQKWSLLLLEADNLIINELGEDHFAFNPVSVPIYQTSIFAFDSFADFQAALAQARHRSAQKVEHKKLSPRARKTSELASGAS